MTKVIGVQFRNVGKIYYFDPVDFEIKNNDRVIVETARGIECGFACGGIREVEDDKIVKPLKSVVRLATPEDIARYEANRLKEKDAFRICRKKIREHKLEMKLVDVEFTFDGQKILFYFTADGRVDFRDLVKDLAGAFRTRIELRQIGVRDESKLLGGIGICGKPFCCSRFLFDFQPVSIKMAKEQGKSLNPAKISGTCGRLMCCLKYEQNVYDDLLRQTPKNGSLVETPDGRGVVLESALLARTVRVRMTDKPDAPPKTFNLDDILVLVNGRQPQKPKNAEDVPAPEAAEPSGSRGSGDAKAAKKPRRRSKSQKQAQQNGAPQQESHSEKETAPLESGKPQLYGQIKPEKLAAENTTEPQRGDKPKRRRRPRGRRKPKPQGENSAPQTPNKSE